MKNLVIIFGGRSVEHDVSILTALHAARSVTETYNVRFVYLTRDNVFVVGKKLGFVNSYIPESGKRSVAESGRKCFFTNGALYRKGAFAKKICNVDAVLNCCHGGFGEDGTVAAALALAGIPVTSCGAFAAAKMQSKSATREVLDSAQLDQPKWMRVGQFDFVQHMGAVIEKAVVEIELPVIVKPDTLGSSIGISVAKSEDELKNALELAFTLDDSVIVEQFLPDIHEVNCAAFRARGKVWVSKCEIISNSNQIFDFETKYLDGQSGFVTKRKFADGEDIEGSDNREVFEKIQLLTRKAYGLFGARGVIRCDFMISGGKVYLNEINTVPGFLSYHLWMKTGIPYGALIDMLVEQAIADAARAKTFKTVFESGILAKNRALVE